MAERYRVQKSRTAAGLWKLTFLYDGIDQAFRNETTGRDIAPAFLALDKKMRRWIKLQPHSPAARLAYTQAIMRHAWAIPGGCYSSCVRTEAWPLFYALVEEARRFLQKTKSIAAIDPHWYEMMLEIGTYQSWDASKFGAAFDAAVAREPLFYPTYYAAVDYFIPKWHGNARDIDVFAQSAIKKIASAEGAGMYARICWHTSQSQFGDEIFDQSLANWPQMRWCSTISSPVTPITGI